MQRPRLSPLPAALAFLLALVACRSTGGSAPPRHQAPDPRDLPPAFAENEAPLVVWFAGLDRALADPKDAGLARALEGLDERLAELFARDLRREVPEEAWRLPWEVVSGPWALRLRIEPTAGPGSFPVSAQLDVLRGDPARLADRAARVLALTGMPASAPGDDGRRALPTPIPASYGPFQGRFTLALGAPPRAAAGGVKLPAGYEPTCALRLDIGAFIDLLGDYAPMMGPEGEELMAFFERFGLENVAVEAAAGSGPDGSLLGVRWLGYGDLLAGTSGDPGARIGTDTLRLIPEDAVWASTGVVDFAGMLDLMLEFARMEAGGQDPFGGKDPLEMLATMCGVHLEDDLLAGLGPEFILYLSDSTGGGGLASLVSLVRVSDPDMVDASVARLVRFVNGLASAETEGRVELRSWMHEGREYSSLTFPGLPVPIEPTWTRVGDWCIAGLTPQAVIVAARQVHQGGPSLLDNPRFAAAAPWDLEDLFMLEFLDTPALLADGYGWSTLLSAAIANGLRSPRDANAGPGLVLPPLEELRAGARGTLTVARLEGEDLLSVTVGDSSALVGLTGCLGVLHRMPVLAALPALAVTGGLTLTRTQRTMHAAQMQREQHERLRAQLEALGYTGEESGPEPQPDDEDQR